MSYKIDVMTLFPDRMQDMLGESILGRASKKNILDINCVQIRDYTENRQFQVDDYPYGGGWGCVLMAQPLKSCLDDILAKAPGRRTRVIYMSPQGQTFTQETAKRLSREYDHLVLVCGHYEGVDERFIEQCVDEEISLGDFVLTGGEIAAMAIADAVCRLVPGVLADEACYTGESHWDGLLEYPQYTRPEVWEGRAVPEVLRSGNHAEVERWRRKKAIERTMEKRPDMFRKLTLEGTDAELYQELLRDRRRKKLTEPVEYRPATEDDIDDILLIVRQARNYLRKNRVDQWQGDYPNAEAFRTDISRGDCFVVTYGGKTAAFFSLSCHPEKTYDGLTDGKWRSDEPYCVLHRCAAAAEFRGSGLSDIMLRFAEENAISRGRHVIRVDTHRKNKAMLALLKRRGYSYRGNILVIVEEGHDRRRQAFDKIL